MLTVYSSTSPERVKRTLWPPMATVPVGSSASAAAGTNRGFLAPTRALPPSGESAGKPDALQTLRELPGCCAIAPAFGVRGACSRFSIVGPSEEMRPIEHAVARKRSFYNQGRRQSGEGSFSVALSGLANFWGLTQGAARRLALPRAIFCRAFSPCHRSRAVEYEH
jgi:hypothetical protein